MLRADVHGEVRPSGRPSATLVSVRELSLLSVAQPVSAIALIANGRTPLTEGVLSHAESVPAWEVVSAVGGGGGDDAGPRSLGSPKNVGASSGKLGNWRAVAPTHCVLIRWGGLLSLLDLDSGTETHLMEVRANSQWPGLRVGSQSLQIADWFPDMCSRGVHTSCFFSRRRCRSLLDCLSSVALPCIADLWRADRQRKSQRFRNVIVTVAPVDTLKPAPLCACTVRRPQMTEAT
jgi:hypothetical protein